MKKAMFFPLLLTILSQICTASEGVEKSSAQFDSKEAQLWDAYQRFEKLFYGFEDMGFDTISCKMEVSAVSAVVDEAKEFLKPLRSQGYKFNLTIRPYSKILISKTKGIIQLEFPVLEGTIDVDPKHSDFERLSRSLEIRRSGIQQMKKSVADLHMGMEKVIRSIISEFMMAHSNEVEIKTFEYGTKPKVELVRPSLNPNQKIKYELDGNKLSVTAPYLLQVVEMEKVDGKLRPKKSNMSMSVQMGKVIYKFEDDSKFTYQKIGNKSTFLDTIQYHGKVSGAQDRSIESNIKFKDCVPTGIPKE